MTPKPRAKLDTGDRCVSTGAVLAVGVSAALVVSVAASSSVGIDFLNMLTPVAASGAGVLGFFGSRNVRSLIAADVLLLVAILPALIGGVGLLYVPSLVLFIVGTVYGIRRRARLG